MDEEDNDKDILDIFKKVTVKVQRSRNLFYSMYIWDTKFENCMLDLRASINVMHTSIYNNLDLGPLQNISLTI